MTPAAYATINMRSVSHNIKKVREYAPRAKIMAVIKANAYGHGLLSIASELKDVDAFAVARVDEGIRLRKAGFTKRIIILEGFVCEEELQVIIKNNLDVVVHSLEQVDILEKYSTIKKISVWLKHDTGMNRLGFRINEFTSVYQRLMGCSNVNQSITLITHLSSADTNSPTTSEQIKIFNESVNNYSAEKSIANSAGIIAWPNSILDWVRPGLMLYGVSPFIENTGKEIGLEPVMSLYSRLIAVKDIEKGETVGYAGTWVSDKKTKIGVVSIGYGDGYPRYAQTGTPVLINGKRVPLIGRVSMDMITVDLSDQIDVKLGDKVMLWGDGLAVEEIAKYADTIPYTLLCGITPRVEMKKI
ncbi:MAG: alanine racemase [Methylococcaceae bacterium]|nr:alanine racemase [Methylococcaceae bacterium]